MNRSILYSAIVFSIAISFFAFGQPSSRPDGKPANTPAAEGRERSFSVQLMNASGLQNIIHQRHGKVLVMNVWATWCLPCMEEFPDLVKSASAYDTSKVEVVGISLDYADEIESKVIPFIKKNKIPFRIYLAQFDSQEKFINSVKKSWNGAIPATFIYDRHGKQKISLIGEQTFDRFKAGIDAVLRSK